MTRNERYDVDDLLSGLAGGAPSGVLDDLEHHPAALELLERHFRDGALGPVPGAVEAGHALGRADALRAGGAEGTEALSESTGRALPVRAIGRTRFRRFGAGALAAGLMLLLALFLLPHGQPVAFAEVIDRVQECDSVEFETTVFTYDAEGKETVGAVSSTTVAAGFGQRKETTDANGRLLLTECVLPREGHWLTLFHTDRSFRRTFMTGSMRAQMATETSPAVWIQRVTSRAEQEGTKRLDVERSGGRTTDVFEWSYLRTSRLRAVVRLSVDRASKLPTMLVEESHGVDPPRLRTKQVSEHFVWGAVVAADFASTVPDEYTERR